MSLIATNKTTIETMDKRNIHGNVNYDMSFTKNWIQVFGRNPFLWLLPMTGKSGKPVGDGIVWLMKDREDEGDEDVPEDEG